MIEATIIESLQDEGWNFDKISNGIYQTLYNNDVGKFFLQLNLINFNSSLILGTSYFSKTVTKNFISQATWQLNDINLRISIGSFQVNAKTGEISYRTGIYFFNTPFQMDLVRNILNSIVSYTNQHHLSISRLLNDDTHL